MESRIISGVMSPTFPSGDLDSCDRCCHYIQSTLSSQSNIKT
jgi:hypothetical protein